MRRSLFFVAVLLAVGSFAAALWSVLGGYYAYKDGVDVTSFETTIQRSGNGEVPITKGVGLNNQSDTDAPAKSVHTNSPTAVNASVILSMPVVMTVDVGYSIEARVGTSQNINARKAPDIPKAVDIRDAFQSTPQIVVRLIGNNFKISELSQARQRVDGTRPAVWQWDVEPQKPGPHDLILTIWDSADATEKDDWRFVESYRKTVNVDVRALSIKEYITDKRDILTSLKDIFLLAISAFGWIWALYEKRSPKNPSEAHTR